MVFFEFVFIFLLSGFCSTFSGEIFKYPPELDLT